MRRARSSPPQPLRSAIGGFTLLEILVGVALLSLIAVAVYSSFRLGGQSWEAGEARARGSADMRLTSEFLHRQLSGAVPLALRERREMRVLFEGDPSQVSFVTEMRAHLETIGLYDVRLAVEGSAPDRRLVVTRALHASGSDEDPDAADQSTLLEGIVELKFAYYGALGKDGPRSWQTRWQKAPRLPEQVRLEVTTLADGAWPPLVIPLFAHAGTIRDASEEGLGLPAPESPIEESAGMPLFNVAARAP